MIYATGDLHGDKKRFRSKQMKKLKRKDSLIVCGDFGFIFGGCKKEESVVRYLSRRKYNLLFVEGVHDNLDLINQYPVTTWNGGKVREISGSLKHLMRGQVYNIEGKTIFTFGGGSPDHRVGNTLSWESDLMPTEEEIAEAWENLAKVNYKVDYIITHEPSRKIKQLLTMEETQPSTLDIFLDKVRDKVEYTGWYFGGFHKDIIIPPKETALFEQVVSLEDSFSLTFKK